MSLGGDQQFCLRWNNFQANITAQFETLRDDEDFTDVTIACEGQRLQGHKVVLSACSPFFKELFKSNPCPHPIIFMRDVEARHIIALMEFMYAGEVNIAQAHLSSFLKTAESLKIRGLTDTSTDLNKDDDILYSNHQKHPALDNKYISDLHSPSEATPPPKRVCKSDPELLCLRKDEAINPFAFGENLNLVEAQKNILQTKVELPDYLSDEEDGGEEHETDGLSGFYATADIAELPGGMEITPQTSGLNGRDIVKQEPLGQGLRFLRRRSLEHRFPYGAYQPYGASFESPDSSSILRTRQEGERKKRLIKLAEGIEIYEDQLRSVKWSDYRKLTRGLATILFSPAELATCSVTGQRWSRAGNGERPVKPALDRAKVQAIISYVATRFPMVEISRIKQVLAYKCKENCTTFKMKAVRYYGGQLNE
ncbi:hypothetical protein JTB14_030799 [Gonioctena quinquepunctata]|nr:hypothetical protein JTB14_030799 [Gonioctena quinquepunctata]